MGRVRTFIRRPAELPATLLAIGITLLFVTSALSSSSAAEIPLRTSPSPAGLGIAPSPRAAIDDARTLSGASSFPTPIQHVVVVMDENQNYSTILADGPFEAYLAHTYATATNDYSVAHISPHAYQAATSGHDTSDIPVAYQNLGDLASAAGLTWAAFEQNMPTLCDPTTDWTDEYSMDHNPFIMYKDIVDNATRCDLHDLTWPYWLNDVNSSAIPNYSFVTPNTINDDHNSSVTGTNTDNHTIEIHDGDAWLKSWLSPLINDSAIFSDTAFLITFDEDAGNANNTPTVNNSSGGHIYMVIVSPYSKGLSSDAFYNSYSLVTTAEWLLGLPGGTLGNDSWTLHPPMEDLFSFTSYSVTFQETGLPTGTSWSVSVGGKTKNSTGTTITFSEEDGTRTYTASVMDSGNTTGSFTVSGSKLTVPLAFYPTRFSEEGLPSGTDWSVTVNGALNLSTTGSADFYLANGTVPYLVADNSGWHQATLPYSGNLTVSGEPLTEPTLVYSQVSYSAVFSESDLASGLSWQVTVNGVPKNLTTTGLTDNLSWTDLPNGTYSYSIADLSGWHQTTLASSGTLAVNGGTGPIDGTGVGYSVTLVYGAPVTYTVTISESTLPSGLNWSITVNGVMRSVTTDGGTESLRWSGLPNGTYRYSIAGISGWHEQTLAYGDFLTVNGGTGSINGTGVGFAATLNYTRVTYSVTFSETGLPSGLTWSVSFNTLRKNLTTDGLTDALEFAPEPNGTYSSLIADNPGYHQTTTPYADSENISGASLAVHGTYAQVTYLAVFSEGGLPSGLSWQVTVNGVPKNLTTTGLTDNLSWTDLPNGTYSYSIADLSGWHQTTLASSGTLAVNGGTGPIDGTGVGYSVTLVYGAQATYTVTISESTLPSGLNWSITFNGVMRSVTTDGGTESLMWPALPNGTYDYTVAAIIGYVASPSAGNVTVHGSPTSLSITFAPVAPAVYSVTFTETGLASGTNWSVTLTGDSQAVILASPFGGTRVTVTRWSDGGTSVPFSASNGNYSYSASAPGHPNATGSIIVSGPPTAPVTVSFGPGSSSPSPSGLPTLDYVLIGLAAVVAAIAALAAVMRRRR